MNAWARNDTNILKQCLAYSTKITEDYSFSSFNVQVLIVMRNRMLFLPIQDEFKVNVQGLKASKTISLTQQLERDSFKETIHNTLQ
jgi:hypothetical protein